MSLWSTRSGNARNGQENANPICWSQGIYDYGLIVRDDWHPVIWRRANGGSWSSYDLSSTALGLVYNEDSHYALSMAVDHLGRIWVAGNSHATAHRVVYSDAGSITNWNTWTAPAWMSHSPYSTYHTFNVWSDGQLFWNFDGIHAPDTGVGRDWLALRMNITTNVWEPVYGDGRLMRVDDHGIPSTDNKPDRSYILNHFIDANDRLHLVGVWRMSDGPSMRKSYYIYSDDRGATWKNINGLSVTLPLYYEVTIMQDEAPIIVNGLHHPLMLRGPMCLDSSGYPVFIGFHEDYWYAMTRWNGIQWVLEDLGSWNLDAIPGMGLRHDGELILIIRRSDDAVYAYKYSGGPNTTDRKFLGYASIGTPGGTFTFESGATYSPIPANATRRIYRDTLQLMIPNGNLPELRMIGSGPLNNV